jgi:hypothetical protein
MGSDRLRVLALALVSLGLIVTSTWILDWFAMAVDGPAAASLGIDTIGISLRGVNVCRPDGVCGAAPMSAMPQHMYATLSTMTLWSSVVLAAVIALQTGARLVAENASSTLTKLGYTLGVGVFIIAFATAYLFQPEVGSFDGQTMGVALSVTNERTGAPLLLLLGIIVGMFALHYAIAQDTGIGAIPQPSPSLAPAHALPQHELEPAPVATAQPRTKSRTMPPPDPLRGKLRFATATAELTRGGIDARREDGSTVLVMWRDVVGVVARRLPPAYEGETFVDVISTAGSTLRILPWTRVTGEPIDGDGERRARELVELVTSRCPDAKLDPATRAFIESRGQAAQLPDVETLAAHDARLA